MINQDIINQMTGYVNLHGGVVDEWYCGITSDPMERKEAHKVPPGSPGEVADAESNEDARDTERALLDQGFHGGEGGGDDSSTKVYIYKKIPGVTDP